MSKFIGPRNKGTYKLTAGFRKYRQAKAMPVVLSRVSRRRGPGIQRLRKELKFFDTAVSFTFDSTSEVPATGQWALIPQGVTQSTRDGRQALIKSVEFRGALTGPSGAQSVVPEFVMWVIQDKQANGAAAAVADVFTGTNVATCLRNLNNNKRFKILKKCEVVPNYAGIVTQSGGGLQVNDLTWPIQFYVPCSILMDWNSTTGAITEITQNNIFIIAGVVDASGAADDLYTLTGTARLRFYAD